MIDRYLERGEMFVARDDGQVVAECVVTDEADRIGEIKNLAVPLQYQRKGYGRQTLEFLEAYYRGRYRTLLVGTGDVPRTLRFLRTMRIRSLALDPRLLHRSLRPPHHRGRQTTGRYGLSEEVLVTQHTPAPPAQKSSATDNPARSGYFLPESSEIPPFFKTFAARQL